MQIIKYPKVATVKSIVTEYLKLHGYDGLCNQACKCHLQDFMPCNGCCEVGFFQETQAPRWKIVPGKRGMLLKRLGRCAIGFSTVALAGHFYGSSGMWSAFLGMAVYGFFINALPIEGAQ